MNPSDKVLEFASKAHEGQVRKYTGVPYITHPIAVAEIATLNVYGLKWLEIVYSIAYLHDVLEDTKVTPAELIEFLLTVFNHDDAMRIHNAVVALTKHQGQDLFEYLDGIKANPDSLIVKLADNTHNTSDLKDKKKLDYYRLIRYYLTH